MFKSHFLDKKQKLTVLLKWPLVWIMPNIKLAIRSFSHFSENKFCISQRFKEFLNSVKLFSKNNYILIGIIIYNNYIYIIYINGNYYYHVYGIISNTPFSDIKVYLAWQYLLGEKKISDHKRFNNKPNGILRFRFWTKQVWTSSGELF